MLFLLGLCLCLYICGVFGAAPIKIINSDSTQDYYLSMVLENIDASECGASITSVSVYENSKWRASSQYYSEDNGDQRYAWDYNNVKFGDMLSISVRIVTTAQTVTLWGIITNLNGGAEFESDQLICDGTASPTPKPTPRPTGKPTSPTIPPPTAETVCWEANDDMPWRSYNNQIYVDGNRFNMKGLSWFGYETGNYNLYGLDYHDEDWYFSWMRDHGFNAMRLPFSGDFIRGSTANKNKYKATIQKAAEYGIMVMVDYHSDTAGAWTDGFDTIKQMGLSTAISFWGEIADLLKDEWNVFMADVFNEPHDVSNDEWGDWIDFCEDVGDEIWSKGVGWLVAVEGTNYDCPVTSCAWGENLIGPKNKGITFDNTNYGANRFIYSPHVYGADVTGSGTYSYEGWEAHFGYLADGKTYNGVQNEAALVIGEFGTTYQGGMVTWLDTLVDYMISIDQRNTFFWCLNPNSGDTGGLLKSDWTTEETGKLAALEKLQPDPSVITYNSNTGKRCISGLGEPSDSPSGSPSGNTPVSSPTDPPTDPPTDGSSGGDGNCRVALKSGSNQWWFAITVDCDDSVSKVEMKASNKGSYSTGTQEWDYFKWTNGQYSTPIYIKVTTSSGVTEGSFSTASCSGSCPSMTASSFTENDNGDNTGLKWPGIVGIVLAVILCIGCCIGGGIYYNKNKNKGVASFKETGTDTPVGGDTPDPQPQIQEMPVTNDDDQEIEVEMNDGVTATQD